MRRFEAHDPECSDIVEPLCSDCYILETSKHPRPRNLELDWMHTSWLLYPQTANPTHIRSDALG